MIMIPDVVDALAAYITRNMVAVTGTGATIPVYTHVFPQGCSKVAVLIQLSPGSFPERYLVGVNNFNVLIWARAEDTVSAHRLMSNLDLLLHQKVCVQLSSTVFSYIIERQSGPERMDSENNALAKYFCTYRVKAELRDEQE